MIQKKHLPVQRVTEGPKHHFFGYFDKFPWDKSGRYLLSQEIDFTARQPVPGEKAVLGMIDLQDNNKFIPFAETDSWCWQQGCMLQWLNDAETKVIYNDREGDHFVARILDVKTGEKQTLCRPIYCLSPDGKWALSLNFARLDRERPGYGYPGAYDKNEKVNIPDDEGIWLVDLKKNTSKLLFSNAEISRINPEPSMENTPGWFNHMLFSPDSKRFVFFHRWRLWNPDGTPAWHGSRTFTANIDGSGLFQIEMGAWSHYTWISNNQLIDFSKGRDGWQYYLHTDLTNRAEVIAKDVFPFDGHCSCTSDNRWMLTDCYPDEKDDLRRLFLYDLKEKQAYEIGAFYSDPEYPMPTRCDLHPNWSRDDRTVCFDSIHEGSRQVYLVDVSEFTRK